MKKTLIVADGIVAKKFIDIIKDKYFTNNYYIIVHKDDELDISVPTSFEKIKADYTSLFRLQEIFSNIEISSVFIVLNDKNEQMVVYENIRKIDNQINIVMKINLRDKILEKNLDKLYADSLLSILDSGSIIASKIVEKLPNIPIIPQEFGLGKGEIMEIMIPYGSVFANRYIGQIEQNKWRIVGIYRKGALILSNKNMIINPNDTLLCVGDPHILNGIYTQVNDDLGQFPAPFGRDICLYIDSSLCDNEWIFQRIEDAIFLQKHLKKSRLIIRIFDSITHSTIEKLKDDIQNIINKNDMEDQINVETKKGTFKEIFLKDSEQKMGLIIMGKKLFGAHLRFLSTTNTPLLRLGDSPLKDIKNSFLDIQDHPNIYMSSVMCDISKQLNIPSTIYEYNQDGIYNESALKEFCKIAKVFDVELQSMQSENTNPLLYIKKNQDIMLQFLPLYKGLSMSLIKAIFSNNTQRMSLRITKNPQIFIPILNQTESK